MENLKETTICLAMKINPGTFDFIELKNKSINYTAQNLKSIAENKFMVDNKFAFADILFPIIDMNLSANDSYGISRIYMEENPYSSIFENNKLATNVSAIEIYSLNTFTLVKFFDLKLPIQIKFNIIKEVYEYYCMYYNETHEEFSDYQLETIKTENDAVICETTHLSLFGVATEPLVTMGTDNNAEMLYKLDAFNEYKFWKSSSNIYIYIYIVLVFWLLTGMSILVTILMICFRRKIKKRGSVIPISDDHLEANDNIEEGPMSVYRDRPFSNYTQGEENPSESSNRVIVANTLTYSKIRIKGSLPKIGITPISMHSLSYDSNSSRELRKTERSPSCPIVPPRSSLLNNFSSNINACDKSSRINQGLDIVHTESNKKRRKLPKYKQNLILILYVSIYIYIYKYIYIYILDLEITCFSLPINRL